MAVIGPGSVQDTEVIPRPRLEGASEVDYVTILNPLTDDFAIRVAQDIPVNVPFALGKDYSGQTAATTQNEGDVKLTYGLNLKNPDHRGTKRIHNTTIIKAGQTINLKGNEAQVAVRQLVNEYLQRQGKQRLMADPTLRREVEDMIIQGHGSIQDLMQNQFRTAQQQLDDAINQSNQQNEVSIDVQPFAGLANQTAEPNTTTGNDSGADPVQQERRNPGRSKKAQ